MPNTSVYRDIAARTGGDIYIGVVGPVRTGKSTFIQRFMETVVLPALPDGYDRERTVDGMPQSASGKTVMTTEPKFVPDEAVRVTLDEGETVRVRMVDCVGYVVPEALGQIENGEPRMVHTPWSPDPLPFREAAETGTRKVITEHSTIAMLVTTDGTIGEIPRESYVDAEERVAKTLAAAGVPYAIILNSASPEAEESVRLAFELEQKYNAPVALVNCLLLDREDIRHILDLLLHEFPVTELRFSLPAWCRALPEDHPVRVACKAAVRHVADGSARLGDVRKIAEAYTPGDPVEGIAVTALHPEDGSADIEVRLAEGLCYRTMSELSGYEIAGEEDLFRLVCRLSETARAYARVKEALDAVEETGYGIVMPTAGELRLEEPHIVKQAGGYGVRLRASARSIHMIRAEIETEISPVVGTEAQSEELAKSLLTGFEEDPERIWHTDLFGKSLYELVGDGLHAKLEHMPEESRAKLSETLERIINEGSNGLICILL